MKEKLKQLEENETKKLDAKISKAKAQLKMAEDHQDRIDEQL